jgi:putative ABC transport system ATP-binding protein
VEVKLLVQRAMPLLMRGARYDEALETSERWLREVGLGARLKQRAGELSGGEQQRVAIARALVQQPVLLLADEPTGDLDRKSGEEILGILEKLNQEYKKTIVMVTHDPHAAERAARQLHLEKGTFVEQVTA